MATRPPEFEIKRPCEHPLAQGLVFAGLGRFTGTTLYKDSSLYGRDGTLTNMDPATDWGRDIGRPTLDFDGSNDWINLGARTLTSTTWTFSAWIKKTVAIAGKYIFDTQSGRAFISPQKPVATYELALYDGTLRKLGNMTAAAVWLHIVVASQSGSHQCWIDGIPGSEGIVAGTAVNIAGQNAIGARYDGTSASWDGRMADPCLWNRALSDAEISALADQSNVMYRVGGNPLLRYRRRWWPVGSGGAGTAWAQLIAESLGISDAVSRIATYARSPADGLGLSENVARAAAFSRLAADDIGLSDAAAKSSGFNRGIADSEGSTDSVSRIAEFARALDDAEGLDDDVSRVAAYQRDIDDGEGLADNLTRLVAYLRAIDDDVGLSDEALKELFLLISQLVEDSIGITDSASRIVAFTREVAEDEGLADEVDRTVAYLRSVADEEGLTDAITKAAAFARAISDAVGLTDEVDDELTLITFLAAWYVCRRRNRQGV